MTWGMPEAAAWFESPGFGPHQFNFHCVAMPDLARGTVLAFDYGLRRIGVAVGELQLGVAHPLTTIASERSQARFDAIAALVAEWRPVALVVGLPLHMDDGEHEMTARARRFARQLEGRTALPVTLVDERLTTHEAASMLHDAGVDSRRQKPVRDQVAAQRILQDYLDRLRDG